MRVDFYTSLPMSALGSPQGHTPLIHHVAGSAHTSKSEVSTCVMNDRWSRGAGPCP